MQLTIQKTKTVGEVKQEFAHTFPSLKIEFFRTAHQKEEGSPLKQMLHDDSLLSVAYPMLRQGIYFFFPTTTVADFELGLQKELGVSVQVFRLSKGVWLETTKTDNLTLAQQNANATEVVSRMRFNVNSLFL
ncbi:hypothetical protein [Flavisolibacter ginsenosidimutans]|uniref:Uncharacterized protein n=1 Tax=Flavisolibacter ginsenosidimutans TaxID=661481 RepID=A0A5B8UNX0_9BACT|nr:hypothetical protein [Flavisolibacter ginsenosidimutans]QEC57919.1 hypothetical protein FSB75_19080 [Flavisolibacter ginsenosidimutans]